MDGDWFNFKCLFLMVFVLFVFVGSVSASDDSNSIVVDDSVLTGSGCDSGIVSASSSGGVVNDTDQYNDDGGGILGSVDSASDSGILYSSSDEVVVGSACSVGDWDSLNDALINGADEINITNDIMFSSQCNITGSVIINGNGHVLDGQGLSRIFYFTNDVSDVVLQDIIFINGYADNGGALFFNGGVVNLVINNCSFSCCSVSCDGGGIFFENYVNNLVISNCSFHSNIAARYGGSLYFNNLINHSNISDCTFLSNSAGSSGGALFFNKLASNVYINSNFKDNFITNWKDYHHSSYFYRYGAAICFCDRLSNSSIKGTFFNNFIKFNIYGQGALRPVVKGGAVCFLGIVSDLIVDANFTKNYIYVYAGGYLQNTYGGAICFDKDVINLNILGIYDGNYIYARSTNTESYPNMYGGAVSFNSILSNAVVDANFTNNYLQAIGNSPNHPVYGGGLYFNQVDNLSINGF